MKSDTAWTQESLAEELGVALRTYKGWENGEAIPAPEYLQQIVTLLNLNKEDEDALYRAALQVPQIIDNLPFKQNPFFTGREEHLKQLHKQLQEMGTATVRPISISGLSGIGKTELALEYAHRYYPNVYRAVLWVDGDMATIESSYANLAEILKLPERNEQKLDRRIQAVKDWLKTHTNWLLIMDNADDLPLAESFLPAKPLGHVLFTTQSQIIGKIAKRARQLEVEGMDPAEGLLFLLLRSKVLEDEAIHDTVATDVREAALQVVELLGRHPLALDQAGAYIEETGVSFTDYINLYHKQRNRLLRRRGSQVSKYVDHPEPVAATLELSYTMAYEQHPLANDILNFCAFLQPDAIPEELFQHDDRFTHDAIEFNDGITALLRYSLIKRNAQKKTLSLHRLVQTVLIDAMSHDQQMHLRTRVVRALQSVFRLAGLSLHSEILLLPHILACAAWTDDELTPTVETARLFQEASFSIAATKGATETLLARAISIYAQQLGDTHLDTYGCQRNLVSHYIHNHKYAQAEALLQQIIAICAAKLGAENPRTINNLAFLADTYHFQSKDEQAEVLYQQYFHISEHQFRAAHPSVREIWLPNSDRLTGRKYRLFLPRSTKRAGPSVER